MAQAQLHENVAAFEVLEADLRKKEEAIGQLTQHLVDGDVTITELRDLADGRGEQLEAEKKRVEDRWLFMARAFLCFISWG